MNQKRILAVVIENEDSVQNVKKFVDDAVRFKTYPEIYVFSKNDHPDFVKTVDDISVVFQKIPDDCSVRSKIKNYVNAFFRNSGFKGFLHVVEENLMFTSNPSTYVEDLEHVMDVFDYNVHFSTRTDGCNYVFSKFNPRVTIHMDSDDFKKLDLPSEIYFTSHSNTAYVVYNYAKIEDDLLRFDENFDVAMYFIIEFLARRRNTKSGNSVYFMNQYLSIPSEYGVYKYSSQPEKQISQEKMASEDAEFKKENVNFAPDNNVDEVMSQMYEKLKSKI